MRKRKLSRKQRRIKNRVTLRTLFLLSITLIFNTYSWFLYASTVSTDLTVHVDAWHVAFEANNSIIEREFSFDILHAYPGMTNRTETITISNTGERPAEINYKIKSIRIFDDLFVSTEQVSETGITPVGATVLTPAQLLSKIQNDYPFALNITVGSSTLAVGATSYLTMSFGWSYESGDDTTDTSYGTRSYDYYENNNGDPVIEIIIKISVIQDEP